MKWTIRTILVLLAAFLLRGTQFAQAADYTGCVTPGGTIIHVGPGDTPLKPCNQNQEVIHLEGSALGIDTRCDEVGLCDKVDATTAFTFGDKRILFSTSGDYPNLAVGVGALEFVTPSGLEGGANTAVGPYALNKTTTGARNTAVGGAALGLNTKGDNNTAVGEAALGANTNGFSNTAVGLQALTANTAGTRNVAVGENALQLSQVGGFNIAIGVSALEKITNGDGNVAVGYEALLALGGAGSNNVAIGRSALTSLVFGDENVAIGNRAGSAVEFGNSNIYIGHNVTGQDEGEVTRIGHNMSQVFISGIWENVDTCDSESSNGCSVFPVRITASGELTTFTSSRKFKENIRDLGDVSQKVRALRPVDFRRKGQASREDRDREVGLIAEEVAEVFPQLALYDEGGKPLSVDFNAVTAVTLREVQRLQQLVEKQQSEIALLRAQQPAIAELTARLERLEASQVKLAAY